MVRFEDISVGSRFTYNGNLWVKQSSKTGYLVAFDRWFYMGMSDIVGKV